MNMDIRLKPLSAMLVRDAGWKGKDAYPAWQEYADELEVLLGFLRRQGQLERFWPRLRSPRPHERDEALQEIRVAYHLSERGFPICDWEPLGAGEHKGEFNIRARESSLVFVEVKAPGWESELSDAQRAAGRQKEEKYRRGIEGGAVGPWRGIRQAIRKAYPKFLDSQANLLVIADDYFVSLNEWGDLAAGQALLLDSTALGERGYFCSSLYENLGGVAFFSAAISEQRVEYQFTLYRNPKTLKTTALPDSLNDASWSRFRECP
jgi:hypothetical protein